MRRLTLLLALLALPLASLAQNDRIYTNPILHQDWSDPDVCRVGSEFYMTASSFNFMPGLPVLHSRDLVNWDLIGSALPSYGGNKSTVQHGKHIWAPSIRWHDGWFYIFAADPDRGIFRVRAKDPAGPWEEPVLVCRSVGYIDPCPFWDDDGKTYLSFAAAGSRAGLKSVIFVAEMDSECTRLLGKPRIVFDGHDTQPTIEGTKFYKRGGYYYLFCPAGGVATGWQTVLRSGSPWGPWEEHIALAWAPGTVNGPHQGAWVDTPEGGDWFIHFQDKGAYGRIVHLQPMRWNSDGWPVIGDDPDGDGTGLPVSSWTAPLPLTRPQDSGIPEAAQGPWGIGLEWQYPAAPSPLWHYALPGGGIRLFSVLQNFPGLWNCPNVLQQKFPAERFTVTARMTFRPNPSLVGEKAGFVVTGSDYAGLRLTDTLGVARLELIRCTGASKGASEDAVLLADMPWSEVRFDYPRSSGNVPAVNYPDGREVSVWVRLEVRPKAVEGNVPDAMCQFLWSTDGKRFSKAGGRFRAVPDMWSGACFGFFCNRYTPKNDSGRLDVSELVVKPEFAPLEGFVDDESAVAQVSLPDPLTFADGKPVRNVRQWEKKRRPELLALFEDQMYGSAPKGVKVRTELLEEDGAALGGIATRKQIRAHYATGEYFDLLLYVPNGLSAPAPTFLGVNFFGNHTVCEDPMILLPDTLRWRRDFVLQERGAQSSRWPLKTILNQGFAVATFCCEDVCPDCSEPMRARAAFDGCTWGAIAAWAWGLSRALDCLEAEPSVDRSRVAVFGHSRMGKAAVWAGASDQRFAMVVSNASGCGGAALSKRRFGETVRRINTHFPHWFTRNCHYWNDNEAAMPFDQHELLALVAPRPLYIGSGSEDLWSDPRGEFLGLVGAGPVYRLYGFETFREDEMPGVGQASIRGVTGCHLRPGRHEITLQDWTRYLEFAKKFL